MAFNTLVYYPFSAVTRSCFSSRMFLLFQGLLWSTPGFPPSFWFMGSKMTLYHLSRAANSTKPFKKRCQRLVEPNAFWRRGSCSKMDVVRPQGFAHAINTCLKELQVYIQWHVSVFVWKCNRGNLWARAVESLHEKLFVKEVPGEAHFEHLRTDSKLWSAAVDSLMTYL